MSANDRIREIEEKLENDDLSSHKRDQLKRERNKLQSQQGGGGISGYRTIGLVALALAVVVGGGYAMSAMGFVSLNVNSPTGNAASQPIDPSQISLEGEPVIGDENAPVTLVAYEDFECPVCQQFDSQVYNQLKTEYVDSGQLKIVWKDFPLTRIHPWANIAAETQECVYRQDNDAFWAVKDKIFDNQGQLSTSNARSRILDWAAEEGVNKEDVRACIQSENPSSEVRQDLTEGQSLGVSGTPTVFINGQRIQGLAGYNQYKTVIEGELAAQSSQ